LFRKRIIQDTEKCDIKKQALEYFKILSFSKRRQWHNFSKSSDISICNNLIKKQKMITPEFSISQDTELVYISLRTPYIKAQSVEIDVQGCDFKFHAYPYFLRLGLPHEVIEDEKSKCSYNLDEGRVLIQLSKGIPGQHFPDLDLLTKLMASKNDHLPSPPPSIALNGKRPLIEDLSVTEVGSEEKPDMENLLPEHPEEYNWDIPQSLPGETVLSEAKYGFNDMYSKYAAHIHYMANEILDIADLDRSTPLSRRQERIQREGEWFDPEHYM
jgi:protein SHQ1